MNRIKSIWRIIILTLFLLSLTACNSPAAFLPTPTQTSIPPSATPTVIPLNQILAGPFTLTIDGDQLVITWAPEEVSSLLSSYLLVGGFLFRKTGVVNADGSEQAEVTAINLADSAGNFPNTGTLTLSDLKSGDYIIYINGTSEDLQSTRIANAEFNIP